MAQKSTQARGGRSNPNSTLRLVAGTVALAGLAYGSYKYLSNRWTGSSKVEEDVPSTTAATLSSNRLRQKQRSDVSISLVVSKTILRQMEQYNTENEDGVDLRDYLRLYPNMVIILYPGLTPKDVECYFEFGDNLRHRILETSKEESVFHLLKQLGSEINLVCFADFSQDQQTIDTQFRLERVLPNVISLNKVFFVDYI